MAKIRILVAEEHTLCCEAICALLRNNKEIEVIDQAYNGKEVLEKVSKQLPDVVLMNANMSIMDGVEVTHQLRKGNITAKVLLITPYENKEYILSGFRAGVNGVLSKYATSADLFSAIRAVSRGDYFIYPSIAKIIVHEYLQGIWKPVRRDPYEKLTPKERQVLKLITEGSKSGEIACRLKMTVKTVLAHRTNMMRKLGIHSKTGLVTYAIRRHLISLEPGK